jgi:hypothetical protein
MKSAAIQLEAGDLRGSSGREPETSGHEPAAPDSGHRADPGRASSGDPSDPRSISHQATIVGLRRLGDRGPRQREISYLEGRLRRSPKAVVLRGLNRNHNHDLKSIFKRASPSRATKPNWIAPRAKPEVHIRLSNDVPDRSLDLRLVAELPLNVLRRAMSTARTLMSGSGFD